MHFHEALLPIVTRLARLTMTNQNKLLLSSPSSLTPTRLRGRYCPRHSRFPAPSLTSWSSSTLTLPPTTPTRSRSSPPTATKPHGYTLARRNKSCLGRWLEGNDSLASRMQTHRRLKMTLPRRNDSNPTGRRAPISNSTSNPLHRRRRATNTDPSASLRKNSCKT